MTGAILLLLGVVFAAAGVSKLISPEPFRATLLKLYGRQASAPLAAAVPLLEVALAAWLFSGASPRNAAAVSVVVLLAFTSVLLRIWRKGLACGCFGEAAESAPAGLVRNVILIGLALTVVLPADASTADGPWSLGAGVVLGRWTVVIGAACAWACVVAVVRRRRMVFSFAGRED